MAKLFSAYYFLDKMIASPIFDALPGFMSFIENGLFEAPENPIKTNKLKK